MFVKVIGHNMRVRFWGTQCSRLRFSRNVKLKPPAYTLSVYHSIQRAPKLPNVLEFLTGILDTLLEHIIYILLVLHSLALFLTYLKLKASIIYIDDCVVGFSS